MKDEKKKKIESHCIDHKFHPIYEEIIEIFMHIIC